MNDEVCEILAGLIRQYGRALCEDLRRTEALLRDLCGTYKREINVLVGAMRERVPADLLSVGAGPKELLLARLRQRLEENLVQAGGSSPPFCHPERSEGSRPGRCFVSRCSTQHDKRWLISARLH